MKTLYSDKNQKLIYFLKEARNAIGLTQAQLSLRLKKPQSYVSKYERGERRLDVIEFLEVCRHVEADPHMIIDKVSKR